MRRGWPALLAEARASREVGGDFPIPAYSESMPPPRLGVKPTGDLDPFVRPAGDDLGWNVSEYEEAIELEPGLERAGRELAADLRALLTGRRSGLSRDLLEDNPAWPAELAVRADEILPRPFALVVPLALSRTQDDKGRVRWTLFGSSHAGPSRAFWRSFDGEDGAGRFARLVAWTTGGEAAEGVRVLSGAAEWKDEGMPSFARALRLGSRDPIEGVRTLVTFRPFAALPRRVRDAYLGGSLRLLPDPWSLVFWWHAGARRLAADLPHALHLPLVTPARAGDPGRGLRIPQSGWLDEVADRRLHRTHRFQKIGRDEDDQVDPRLDDPVTVALFSTDPDVIGLYGKPMARNSQIWSRDHRPILDGPTASREELREAGRAFRTGGRFRYRLYYPPMAVGERAVFWHRPLVVRSAGEGRIETLAGGALGYMSAEREGERPIELCPRLLDRDGHREAACALARGARGRARAAALATRRILEATDLLGGPVSPAFARRLAVPPRRARFESWLETLEAPLARAIRAGVSEADPVERPSLTFDSTRTREFEERYWSLLVELSTGSFLDKNNCDPIAVNRGKEGGALGRILGRGAAPRRDLEALGDHLRARHERAIEEAGMAGRAFVADHVFRWETEFDYDWWGGWTAGRRDGAVERNVVVVIPGRDRSEAVVMADHYDTAYMEDVYHPSLGADRLRLAAHGADDNHSATAALLLAAEALLPLAREGRLSRDVWLVHLTGEEFPADCLGARALASSVVSRRFALVRSGGETVDLSSTRVAGVYVLDMIAHNGGRPPDAFQIAPGEGAGSARLARLAHEANEDWNRGVAAWNAGPGRRRLGRAARVAEGTAVPAPFRHLALAGEVRPEWDPRSALYNTDGQIFSDAGIPVVLFMEDYDIRRVGYHDTHDTMKNIDLDYGSALAAIAIETVARCAAAGAV